MKFLTIRQPWASLIAVGAKTVETRPFSTKYRGPLAIHAGKARPVHLSRVGEWSVHSDPRCMEEGAAPEMRRLGSVVSGELITDRFEQGLAAPMPFGAVVAVCDLVDVVPIVPERGLTTSKVSELGGKIAVSNPETCPIGEVHTWLTWKNTYGGRSLYADRDATETLKAQLPFGDFTPGRYAWLLESVRPIDPVPMKGAQGLRDVPADVLDQIEGVAS